MTIILTILSLILSNNVLMSGIKKLSVVQNTNTVLRVILVVLSGVGILSAAALNGTPIDTDSLSALLQLLVETLLLAYGSHWSYKVIKS